MTDQTPVPSPRQWNEHRPPGTDLEHAAAIYRQLAADAARIAQADAATPNESGRTAAALAAAAALVEGNKAAEGLKEIALIRNGFIPRGRIHFGWKASPAAPEGSRL